MTKKERLKKEKEKQLLKLQKQENSELSDKENFKESKISQKYKRKAKKDEHKFYLVAKLVMLIPFGWSAFYGVVLAVAILLNIPNEYDFTEFSTKTAVLIGVGILITSGAIVLHFYRKYLAGYMMAFVGTFVYIKGVNQFVLPILDHLDDFNSDAESMTEFVSLWKTRCYPMWAVVCISMVILLVYVISFMKNQKKIKEKRDNAPVKSILSD